MRHAIDLLRRDLTLALREGGALGTALGFYLVVVAMLPLSLGPDLALLTRIAPGILWVALLLSALLSLPRLYEADQEDGVLELLAMSPLPLEAAAGVKALAHWLSTGLPLVLIAPLLGLMLNLELAAYPSLVATMLVGTPAISFIGSIGAALTLRSRRGGLLIAVLVLPLYIPTLIFGISAIEASVLGTGGFGPSLMILGAISLASLVIGPIAAAAAVRLQLG
ncbi:MAG: heme exporter protein CcmB [Proteobacteria bacterium]|nr:heme exporter protein CcmB [Pseudomonadota bacterium]